MPGGRPTRLNHKILAPTPDEPERRLTVAEFIYERMETTGLRPELIARIAGVDRNTVEAWLKDGQRAIDKGDKGELLNIQETRFAEFLTKCRAAHGKWAADLLDTSAQLARGGLIVGKIVEKVDPTKTGDDGKPLVIERRVESAKALPNLEAIWKSLERLATDESSELPWGGKRFLSPRVEVTGADGGPVEVESREDRAARLAAELQAFQSGADAQRALDGDRELASFQAGADAQKALDTDREHSNGQGAEA